MRRHILAVLFAFPLVAAAPLVAPGLAWAADVFVETNPSTARAGDEISVRASCTDNLKAGTVTGKPFGSVQVTPRYGFLTKTVLVATGTRPGDYDVELTCPDGSRASNTLHVVAKVEPRRGPATGGGGTAGGHDAPVLIGGGVATIVAGLTLALANLRKRARPAVAGAGGNRPGGRDLGDRP